MTSPESEDRDPIKSEMEQSLQDMKGAPSPDNLSTDSESGDKQFHHGKIAGVSGRDVFVELGPRMQGVISVDEFDGPPRLGEAFDFVIRGQEDDLYLLSRQDVRELTSWREIAKGKIVSARVTGQNTGGLELKVGPIDAFMPASQAALQHVEDLSKLLGETFQCEVLEVDRRRKRVLISRRKVLEREVREKRAHMTSTLAAGAILKGTVTRLETFGAFVELEPGVEGLLHVSNISRRRVNDPSEVLKPGQVVEVQVLKIEQGGRRIGLGMKQLEANPWDEVQSKFRIDSVLTGKVVRVATFGAFVEVTNGIEGLVHVSQLGGERGRPVGDVAKVGEEITVRVVSIEPERERIGLSRLDRRGSVIGSVEEAEENVVDEVLKDSNARGGVNLGDLLRKALDKD